MDKINRIQGIAVLGLVLAVIGIGVALSNRPTKDNIEIGGTPGGLLAENYDPYVRYNGGYKTEKPIETDDTLTASDISVDDDATITDDLYAANISIGTTSATYELNMGSTASATTSIEFGKFCIKARSNTTGTVTYLYINNTGSLATSTVSCF